jgi:hypothetical protein
MPDVRNDPQLCARDRLHHPWSALAPRIPLAPDHQCRTRDLPQPLFDRLIGGEKGNVNRRVPGIAHATGGRVLGGEEAGGGSKRSAWRPTRECRSCHRWFGSPASPAGIRWRISVTPTGRTRVTRLPRRSPLPRLRSEAGREVVRVGGAAVTTTSSQRTRPKSSISRPGTARATVAQASLLLPYKAEADQAASRYSCTIRASLCGTQRAPAMSL